MTPRRALVMRTFAQAYIDALPPEERLDWMLANLLKIDGPSMWSELHIAASEINERVDRMLKSFPPSPIPNPGVSP